MTGTTPVLGCLQTRRLDAARNNLFPTGGLIRTDATVLIGVTGIVMLAAAGAAQPAARASFTVGTATAAPGTTATGVIPVPAGSDSGVDIPVAVVNGNHPGPVVALIAGTHGTEYSSIIALQQIIPRLDATRLSGTVIVVPVANVPSFERMTPRVNPGDGKAMGGGVAANRNGTQSERALALLASAVIAPSQAILDFHGGDLDEDVGLSFIGLLRVGQSRQDSTTTRLALAFGLDHLVVYDLRPTPPGQPARSLPREALRDGKSVFYIAVGRGGIVTQQDIATCIDGSLNVLAALAMLDRQVHPVAHPVWLDGSAPRISTDQAGAFVAAVKPGARMSKGQVFGYLTDLLGRKTEEIRSPVDGLVMYVHGLPSVWPGAVLGEVLPILPTLPPWTAPPAR